MTRPYAASGTFRPDRSISIAISPCLPLDEDPQAGQSKTWPEGVRGFLVSRRRLHRRRCRVFGVPADVGTSVCPLRSLRPPRYLDPTPFPLATLASRTIVHVYMYTTEYRACMYVYMYIYIYMLCIYVHLYLYARRYTPPPP